MTPAVLVMSPSARLGVAGWEEALGVLFVFFDEHVLHTLLGAFNSKVYSVLTQLGLGRLVVFSPLRMPRSHILHVHLGRPGPGIYCALKPK